MAEGRNLTEPCLRCIRRDTLVNGIRIVIKPYKKNVCPRASSHDLSRMLDSLWSTRFTVHRNLLAATREMEMLRLAKANQQVAEGEEIGCVFR